MLEYFFGIIVYCFFFFNLYGHMVNVENQQDVGVHFWGTPLLHIGIH